MTPAAVQEGYSKVYEIEIGGPTQAARRCISVLRQVDWASCRSNCLNAVCYIAPKRYSAEIDVKLPDSGKPLLLAW